MSSRAAGLRWPGVLLFHDAFLVRADPTVLQNPPGDLVVCVGESTRAIDEILLIAEPGADDRTVGMIRLARGIDQAPTAVVDRAAVTRAWREGRPLWSTLRELGVVPADRLEPTGPIADVAVPPTAIAVKSVTTDPVDWCTIFWWLC